MASPSIEDAPDGGDESSSIGTDGGGVDSSVSPVPDTTLDTGSTLHCEGNSTCSVKCPKGGCTAECGGSAGCTVECGGTVACHIDCNGKRSQDCAAGTTCTSACGGSTGPDAGKGKP